MLFQNKQITQLFSVPAVCYSLAHSSPLKVQRSFQQSNLCWDVSPFLFSAGPGVAGYLTAGTGTTVMPSGPPPVDNDSGDQGWWTCSHTCIAQAPRLHCSSTAAAQTGTVSFQAGEMKREDRRSQAIIVWHQTSETPRAASLFSPLADDTQVFTKNKQKTLKLF